MPNKDWYWDRFQADLIQGDLDLSDAQTSALQDNEKYTDQQAADYETRFIDELYGTDDRAWVYPDERYGANPNAPEKGAYHLGGEMTTMGSGHVTWGLDLVRDWTGKEHLKVGTDEHYKWQTTGKVDWAHYYNDNAYQAAFKEYRNEKNNYNADDWSNLKDYFQDIGDDAPSDKQKIDFLDWAKTYDAPKETEGDWWKTWDNKYVDQFDPDKAEPYKATYLDVPDLWGQTEFEAVLEPMEVTPPAGLPSLSDIQRTQVNVPDSLQSWGEAKSAPTNSFKPGGGGSSGGGSPPPPTTQGGKD